MKQTTKFTDPVVANSLQNKTLVFGKPVVKLLLRWSLQYIANFTTFETNVKKKKQQKTMNPVSKLYENNRISLFEIFHRVWGEVISLAIHFVSIVSKLLVYQKT